jgi:hypothetical protein
LSLDFGGEHHFNRMTIPVTTNAPAPQPIQVEPGRAKEAQAKLSIHDPDSKPVARLDAIVHRKARWIVERQRR